MHVTNVQSSVVTCRVIKSSIPGVLSLWDVFLYSEKVAQESSTRAVPKVFWITVHSPHFCRLHASLSHPHELKTRTSAIWPAQCFLPMPKPSCGLQAISSCTSRDHGLEIRSDQKRCLFSICEGFSELFSVCGTKAFNLKKILGYHIIC